MTPIFANRVLLPPGRKAADAVSGAILKCINENTISALVPSAKGESLGNKYESAIDVTIPCQIESGLIVCTSGSTGNPKAVEISSQSLISATNLVNKRFTETASWLLAINPAFIGGAMVIARAIAQEQKWEY